MDEIEVVVMTWAEIAGIFALLFLVALFGRMALVVLAFMARFTRIFLVV